MLVYTHCVWSRLVRDVGDRPLGGWFTIPTLSEISDSLGPRWEGLVKGCGLGWSR